MAVGLPLKTTYANGDVYSAGDVNDTNGTVNLVGQTNNVYAAKNKFLNADFSIWQRGTTINFSAAGGYVADRWKSDAGGGGVLAVTRQAFTPGQTDVPNAIYFLQAAYSTSGTGTVVLEQRIEDVNTFAGQAVTLSFYAKVNTGTKSVTPRVIQEFGSGGSGGVLTNLTAQTLTTSWQRFTISTTIPSITGKTVGTSSYLRIDLDSGTSGILTFSFANFQLEKGSTATAFQTASGTIQGELALCQRYYYRSTVAGDQNRIAVLGGNPTTSIFDCNVAVPSTFRGTVSAIDVANIGVYINNNNTVYSGGTWTVLTGIATAPTVRYTHTSGAMTQGHNGFIVQNGATAGYFGLSAEL